MWVLGVQRPSNQISGSIVHAVIFLQLHDRSGFVFCPGRQGKHKFITAMCRSHKVNVLYSFI